MTVVVAVPRRIAAPVAPRRQERVDPRTVLAHLVVLSVLTLAVHAPAATGVLVLVTAGFVAWAGRRPGPAVTMVLTWAVVAAARAALLTLPTGSWSRLVLPTVVVLARLAPLMGAYLLFTSLSVSRFVSALERLRLPRTVTVPMAVMLRFAPTIGLELRQIHDALRTRGIRLDPLAVAAAPLRTGELVVVPLIQRCLTIAEELSAAAVTRGLENPAPRTSRIPLRATARDAWYVAVLVATSAGVLQLDRVGG
ncbi:MAG TPA: energy-coupling factor transporter transmembrane component T [Cellulomonas sp.]